ncbi:hypothetical protein MOC55_13660 [Bacillus spizizenii]|uniref:Uncharacterized protein n=1 Tax=Bacillus spizizenii TaxID=96241 RepID=A0A9Q4DV52_BACSC|nr:hypothetical protein [Bacillus subtilis]MCY8123051.1 hypothetical protein [Bacillus spizizenii]MUG00705.1 hypothetical protein [Bacillus tequilensis]MCY8155510.1 hypothetical protein [Bacillus spizizenii]MCY8312908.1 hypothetical protein [Bacillus spizizenii]MCY8416677.1 hypothetical protein [Bacillus spizizenii]
MSERFDSLDKYYKTINSFDLASRILFWVNTVLTVAVYFLDGNDQAKSILTGLFIITTLLYFVADNSLGIFLIPGAEEKRRTHLLTNSFGVPLDNERTNKYYNNTLEPSLLKLGANVFENSLFASRVTSEMAKQERWKILFFVLVLVVSLMIRNTDIELISIVAQTIFTSTLLSSWVRLEVLRKKNKDIYKCLYDVFLLRRDGGGTNEESTYARILDCFVQYESAKAYSGVKQSSKIFFRINDEVTAEWEQTKRNLKIEERSTEEQ